MKTNKTSEWTREELEQHVKDSCCLLLEARDALPAISLASAKLHRIDLTLASRIESLLEPWLLP